MKKFILSIYKGHELKLQKTVEVSGRDHLKAEKDIFWFESPYKKRGKNWMGVKRVK